VLFGPILEFGAFAQENGMMLNRRIFGMLGERAQEEMLRSFKACIVILMDKKTV